MNGIAALDVHPHWRYVLDTGGRWPGADAGLCVSIHALRKEGDQSWCWFRLRAPDFYPRPPRGGRRLNATWQSVSKLFLSTPSARRATAAQRPRRHKRKISIHALREEGDLYSRVRQGLHRISIHALREEGDKAIRHGTRRCYISIHALREEGDQRPKLRAHQRRYFYPRPPRGGRLFPRIHP